MARFTCTNCGYSIDNVRPREEDLSCPGCRHCLETDDDQGNEILEQDHIFFEELISGQTGAEFLFDEPAEESEREQSAVPAPAEAKTAPRQYRPGFEGTAGAYFGVWLVNVILSVVTIGIFTVWAKKRVRKYFLNTILINGRPLASVAEGENIYAHMTGYCSGSVQSGILTIECSAKPSKLFWIRFSNILAGIFSLGLLIPWAKVRSMRYIISTMTIITDRKIR